MMNEQTMMDEQKAFNKAVDEFLSGWTTGHLVEEPLPEIEVPYEFDLLYGADNFTRLVQVYKEMTWKHKDFHRLVKMLHEEGLYEVVVEGKEEEKEVPYVFDLFFDAKSIEDIKRVYNDLKDNNLEYMIKLLKEAGLYEQVLAYANVK